MKQVIATMILCLLLPVAAAAQAPAGIDTAAVDEAQPRIRIISLGLHGGRFSAGTYFELPQFGPRTELAEGANLVFSYDGRAFTLPDFLYAPQKEIESGVLASGRLGFFLSRNFHIDLVAAYGRSKARATFMYAPTDGAAPYRINPDEVSDVILRRRLEATGMDRALWTDDGFAFYKGGGALVYDSYDFRLLGLVPSFGIGVGGIINRFTYIEDKTALYFELSGGLIWPVSRSLQVQGSYTATMLSLSTMELHYGKQMTYGLASLGVTWLFDVSRR